MLPSTYFGPITYFGKIVPNGRVAINCIERFQKQTIRNRAGILGANGEIRLTVPLLKWSTKVSTNQLRIDNTSNWKHVHWMSIQSAYRNSAFFEHYEGQIKSFFNEDHDLLINLNLASINLTARLLKVDFKIDAISESHDLSSGSFNDMTSDFVKKRRIEPIPEYVQVFSDRFEFAPDLSILDLIFNLGPRASIYLENLHKNG